jgi:serine/threonine protein phosphatase 1
MLRRLFQRGRPVPDEVPLVNGRPPCLPQGVRVYAVGDIHGRFELLCQIEEMIAKDVKRSGLWLQNFLVFVGDYVDRGYASKQVLQYLAHPPNEPPYDALIRVPLLGNHDLWFRQYLRGEPVSPAWLRFGGVNTLASYSVAVEPGEPEERVLEYARPLLLAELPESHLAFLDGLEPHFPLGDYFFCHAGIRPNVPLVVQKDDDLLWIRDPFLDWRGDAGKIVVHGHTVEARPVVRRNRIGIDTGAYATGILTCLVLEGCTRRFLTTAPGSGARGPRDLRTPESDDG